MKPVAIVMAQSHRVKLTNQTVYSLYSTGFEPFKLFARTGMEDGEMKTVNSLIKSIDYDWEWLVRTDDDMYFDSKWLLEMMIVIEKNPDIWLLGGCRYPTHKILEKRNSIYITDIAPGNHWLISRRIFEKYGPFYEDYIPGQAEDVRFCQALQKDGGKVAVMSDPTLVVHCGLTNTKGRGRGDFVKGYMTALTEVVGAYME